MPIWPQLLAATQKPSTEEEMLLALMSPQAAQYNPNTNLSPTPQASMNLEAKPSSGPSRPQFPVWQNILAPPPKTPEMQALENEQANAIASQRIGIGTLESQKKTLEDNLGRPDLAPVIGLTDWLSGGKAQALKGYERPPTPEEAEKMKFGLEEAIQKRRGELSSDIAANLRNKQLISGLNEARKDQRFDRSQNSKSEKALYQDLDKNFITPAREKGQLFNQMEAQLAAGKYQDVLQSLSTFARQIGGEKGALSDSDVGRQLPVTIQSDVARLEQYFTGNAKADPAQIEQLKKTLEIAKRTTHEAYSKALDTKKKLYSSQSTYKPLFQQGEFGDTGFGIANEALDSFKPTTAATPKTESGGMPNRADYKSTDEYKAALKSYLGR